MVLKYNVDLEETFRRVSKNGKYFNKVNKCHKMKVESTLINTGSWYIGNSFRLIQCAPTSNTFCVCTCAGSFSKESHTFLSSHPPTLHNN